MPRLNKGSTCMSKKGQPKKGEITDHVMKKRPGATPDQMRAALTAVFMEGIDGKQWTNNEAARRVGGVSKSVLGRAVTKMCAAMRKIGHDGYTEAIRGKRRVLPSLEKGSRGRSDLEKIIASSTQATNVDRFAAFFTPDEEKLLVDVVEARDFYGFGMDRKQLQLMARSWARSVGLKNTDCGRMWFHGWLKRAKLYKPDFGESKRSKMDVMRAQKQSPHTINTFFNMVDVIYAKSLLQKTYIMWMKSTRTPR